MLVIAAHVLVGTGKPLSKKSNLAFFGLMMTLSYHIFTITASMLEVARLIVDSGWVPPRPLIFLFNGAEELFLLVGIQFFVLTEK